MGLKEIGFIVFLILTISFPFFFSKKEMKIEKESHLPYVTIKQGSFKSYDNLVINRKGHFYILHYFDENNYTAKILKVEFLDKNSTVYAKKLIFNGIYNFTKLDYITDNGEYLADTATYDKKNGILLANEIHYTIKGLK